jgi:hypothetical protein
MIAHLPYLQEEYHTILMDLLAKAEKVNENKRQKKLEPSMLCLSS